MLLLAMASQSDAAYMCDRCHIGSSRYCGCIHDFSIRPQFYSHYAQRGLLLAHEYVSINLH